MPIIKGFVRNESMAPINGIAVRAHRRDTGAVLGEALTAPVTAGDTLEELIALRLNFDGGIADTSQYAHAVTAAAGAVIAPGVGRFGDGLDCTAAGSEARIICARSPHLKVTGAFCLEFHIKMAAQAYAFIVAGLADPDADDGTKAIQFFATDSGAFSCKIFGSSRSSPAATYTVGQWNHVAVTRDVLNNTHMFIDGVPVYSGIDAGQMSGDPIWKFGAYPYAGTGWHAPGEGGKCLLDNVRLTIGHERYLAEGFAPPAEAFAPGAAVDGQYEISADYSGECYVVCFDDDADPMRNHQILRTTTA